jgi:hypothetical protein
MIERMDHVGVVVDDLEAAAALAYSCRPHRVPIEKRRSDAAGSGSPPCPSRLGREAAPCAHLWRLGVRGVFEVRQEMSRGDVENPRAASSPE